MEYVPIPLAALDAPGYQALTIADRQFLVDLYVLFWDTATFTVDIRHPQNYRQAPGVNMGRKVARLLDAGLIQITGSLKKRYGNDQRVFAFTHPTHETIQEAA